MFDLGCHEAAWALSVLVFVAVSEGFLRPKITAVAKNGIDPL